MSRRNKSDHWVSHNKVLNSSTRLCQTGRNPNFETEETKLLITLWGRPQIQKLLITSTKKFPIIQNLSNEMKKHGFKRSPEEINTRIKNLKCFYNRMKKDVEIGILREPTWRHYDAMKKVLEREVFGKNKEIASILRRDAAGLNHADGQLEDLKKNGCFIVPKAEPMDETQQPEIKIEVEEDFPSIVESDTPMNFPNKEVTIKKIQPSKLTLNNGSILYSKPPNPLPKTIPIQTNNSTMKVIFVNKVPPTQEAPKIPDKPNTSKPPETPKGFQSLLKEMLEQQKQQIEIENERLELEKERFKFEKEIGENFLKVLPAILEFTKKFNNLEDEDVDVDI